jgi:hypothetical protein
MLATEDQKILLLLNFSHDDVALRLSVELNVLPPVTTKVDMSGRTAPLVMHLASLIEGIVAQPESVSISQAETGEKEDPFVPPHTYTLCAFRTRGMAHAVGRSP